MQPTPPVAFTPTRSDQNVPDLVNSAGKLRRSGFDHLVCIRASDPFLACGRSKVLDPGRKAGRVCDGNLHLARALGLTSDEQKLIPGDRSRRDRMVARKAITRTVRVEARIAGHVCTRTDDPTLGET